VLGAVVLLSAVLVLPTLLVTHVALAVRCWGEPDLSAVQRALLWVPVANVIVAWRTGKSWHVVLWACLFVAYGVLVAVLTAR
jgi:hypothetical protein